MDLQKASDHQESCPSPKRSQTPGIFSNILDSIDFNGMDIGRRDNSFSESPGSGMKNSHEDENDDDEEEEELDHPPMADIFVSFSDMDVAKPVVSQISKPNIFAPSCTSLIGVSAARSILKSPEDVTAKRKAAKKVRFSDTVCMRAYRKNAKDIKQRREYVQEIMAKRREEYRDLLIRRRKAYQDACRHIEELESEDSE